jgi:hypothetical protein
MNSAARPSLHVAPPLKQEPDMMGMFWSIFIQSAAFVAAVTILGGVIEWLTSRGASK